MSGLSQHVFSRKGENKMATERLSKLQKWIFKRMNKNAKPGQSKPHIYRQEIYTDYYGLSHPRFGTWPLKYRVSISRSLKRLQERGLIESDSIKQVYVYTRAFEEHAANAKC